eukprot:1156469-Pelagomonas_calceolata.AAC.1
MINHCPNVGMHTDRQHVGISSCVKALSKGRYSSSLTGMDACQNERLLEQDIVVPENISRAIPDWGLPTGTGSSAWNQSRPAAVFVRSIPGRPSHIDPTKILPQDRDIHLVEVKFCPDTNPFPTLEATTLLAKSGYRPQCFRSAAFAGGYNKVTLPYL